MRSYRHPPSRRRGSPTGRSRSSPRARASDGRRTRCAQFSRRISEQPWIPGSRNTRGPADRASAGLDVVPEVRGVPTDPEVVEVVGSMARRLRRPAEMVKANSPTGKRLAAGRQQPGASVYRSIRRARNMRASTIGRESGRVMEKERRTIALREGMDRK
jgi:hypothetical protein